ncbi:MAG: (Fe-S)-binding protein [candidate division WOR-3 bacterium]|nr:MAG: (Fe-S)-binding protein [candidate division WOR-3 bacterium]
MANKKNIVVEINPEIREALVEMGAVDAYKCYQCGKCASVCPWFQVGTYEFLVFRFPLETVLGLIASSEDKDDLAREVDKIYRCVGCEACVDQCPLGVKMPHILRSARRILVDFGSYPENLKSVVQKIRNVGNPLGEPREKRADWAEEIGVKDYSEEMEILYFACCLPSYDTRLKNVAKATAFLLKRAGVSFGILGAKESCCGEAIRRVGAESVYQETARSNIGNFKESGVKKVLVSSPHCYVTFQKEYPDLGGEFDAVHSTEFFWKCIEQGKILPKKSFGKKVVYHDPCTLGRQSGIYDAPRNILGSIPDLELLEVEDFSRNLSLCCGAGSGALWIDWPKGERMADIRIKQLVDTGADVIAVACPYCLQMFEETVKAMNLNVQVMDVSEILFESLGEDEVR